MKRRSSHQSGLYLCRAFINSIIITLVRGQLPFSHFFFKFLKRILYFLCFLKVGLYTVAYTACRLVLIFVERASESEPPPRTNVHTDKTIWRPKSRSEYIQRRGHGEVVDVTSTRQNSRRHRAPFVSQLSLSAPRPSVFSFRPRHDAVTLPPPCRFQQSEFMTLGSVLPPRCQIASPSVSIPRRGAANEIAPFRSPKAANL